MLFAIAFLLYFSLPQLTFAADKPATCTQLYDELFEDEQLDVLVVYGYKDSRPQRFVGDRHERLIMVQKILSPCSANEKVLCQFQRSPDDGELFFRNFNLTSGKEIRIQMSLIASSRGPDDDINRESVFQKHSSQYVRRTFLGGFDRYEMILYNGHSRAGGGPDFFVPRLLGDNSLDYGYYKKNQPGFNRILEVLNEDSKAKVLGLFSCASSKYFRKRLLKKNSGMVLVSSKNLLYHTDANQNMFEFLKGILNEECRSKLNKAMRSTVPRVGSQVTFPKE